MRKKNGRALKSSSRLEEKTKKAKTSFSSELSEIFRAYSSEFTILVKEEYELEENTISEINECLNNDTAAEFLNIFDLHFKEFLNEILSSMIANLENPDDSYLKNSLRIFEDTIKGIRPLVSKLFQKNNRNLEKYCRNTFYAMIKNEDRILRTLLRIKQKYNNIQFPKALNLDIYEQINQEIEEFKKKVQKNHNEIRDKFKPNIQQEWVSKIKQKLEITKLP